MKRNLFVLLMTLCLLFSLATFFVSADENGSMAVIFEESFEEYEKNINVSSTTMPNFFVCDYNSIGDGIINVQEDASGNLYLFSHVFTQIYCATPVVGAYEFSLDILEAQGSVQTGVFVRAPKTTAAFYEGDGHPDTSVGQSGLFLYTRGGQLGVNVKTYDEQAAETARLKNNTVTFPLPAGASYPYNLRVTDTGSEMTIYVNDTLMCYITLADPGHVYDKHESEGKCFGSAKLYDAEGNEKGTYTHPLLSSDGSIMGWTTRAANMAVDNVRVKANPSYQTILAINKLPAKVTDKNVEDAKELVAEARALYDALSDAGKALVINYSKLTKAEDGILAIEAVTETPTEPPTEEPTDAPTDAPIDAPTDSVTETPTETLASEQRSEAETEATVPVIVEVEDSLAVWILAAVMLIAVGITAGYITVKVRK
ncbi:MAG: hypothetical protein E7645_00040 [Ruminococcaceae bacterium]|nr:hypothetical protein [Oscillospiraceae bacterium]